MTTRRSTPDILGSVLDGTAVKQESHKAIKKELNIETMQQNNKASARFSLREQQDPALNNFMLQQSDINNSPEDLKEKATFNLSVAVLRRLEDKWMEIRKITGSKQISKTLIVEIALEMAFAEFELQNETSLFYSKLANHKTVKQ